MIRQPAGLRGVEQGVMLRTVAALAVLGVCTPALRAGAQNPAERSSLDSIHAAYEARADSTWLVVHEHELIALARADRDNPMLHMELGFLAYRLGEVTGVTQRYEDAASEFQWTADLRAQWPYAWYWLGMSELGTGEGRIAVLENIRQLIGVDYLSAAAHAFAQAVLVDSSFARGLVDLATTAMRQRVAPRLVLAQALLRQMAGGPAGRVKEVQLVRGRIERRMEEPDSALTAFRAYLALGGDSAVGGLELARTFALEGRFDSCRAWYFRGLARVVSDSSRAELRRDLRWIATAGELAALDGAPSDSVGAVLRRFWDRRDAQDGRRSGERLGEQLRRYHYAEANFALVSRRRKLEVAFAFHDTTQADFDDRGIVYLRHGEPAERAQFASPGFDANESWLYHRGEPDGDLLLHFVAVNAGSDYRLMESLRAVCRPRARYIEPLLNANLQNSRFGRDQVPGAETRCVESRARLSETYERLARAGALASADMWANERTASLEMVHDAVSTDSYVHHYTASLRPVVSWFAVADDAMIPELHVVFAVPASRLHPVVTADGSAAYPLTLRLLVADSASGRLVASMDTLRVFRSAQRLGPSVFLTEQLVLSVPAGRYRYAFVIEEEHAAAGDAVSHQALDVPRMGGPFAASDLVLGREGSGLTWRRSAGDVALNPLMRFPRDGVATLYYELYGLSAGAAVATRVRVITAGGRSVFRRLFGGGGGADLSYTTITEVPGRSAVRQHIDLHGLASGRYTLQVEFTDPSGNVRIVRTSPFEIEGRAAP
jgi:GWxTD domain-containing protein